MNLGERVGTYARALRVTMRGTLDQRMVFLHVPKCGGNSVTRALREVYGWPLPRGRRRCFHVVPRRSGRAAALVGLDQQRLRDVLLHYHLCDHGVRLVTGHLTWPEALREAFPDLAIITLLREPVAHFLSGYFFMSEDRGQPDPITVDLPDFLETERARRMATRFVTVLTGEIDPDRTSRPETIDLAKRRLAQASVVGVLEDVPAFVDAFERRFGARLRIPHLNEGRSRPSREHEEVTDEMRARVAELVAPNREVYDVALALVRATPNDEPRAGPARHERATG